MTAEPTPVTPSPFWRKAVAAIALIFGALTVLSGGNVLFGPAQAREMAGNYIAFVVWFNFLAGFFYIIAATGLWMNKAWATRLAKAIAAATAVIILVFAVAVFRNTAFEMRTIGALSFRFLFWAAIALTMRDKGKGIR